MTANLFLSQLIVEGLHCRASRSVNSAWYEHLLIKSNQPPLIAGNAPGIPSPFAWWHTAHRVLYTSSPTVQLQRKWRVYHLELLVVAVSKSLALSVLATMRQTHLLPWYAITIGMKPWKHDHKARTLSLGKRLVHQFCPSLLRNPERYLF